MKAPALLAVLAVTGCGGGEKLDRSALPDAPPTIQLTSDAFRDGGAIPVRYTCDGSGRQPPVRFSGVPDGARELALVVVDPTAPGGRFVHLTLYDVAPQPDGMLPMRGRTGENSTGHDGWTPPCPPKGNKPHRYTWTLYALSARSHLAAGATPTTVAAALNGKVLARGTLAGTYARGK